MKWLQEYSKKISAADQLVSHRNHLQILMAGLFGEAGSIVAEFKKLQREQPKYPDFKKNIIEEMGDFLWYYTRVLSINFPRLISKLPKPLKPRRIGKSKQASAFMEFISAVSLLIEEMGKTDSHTGALVLVWERLNVLSQIIETPLQNIARVNLTKIESRWPSQKSNSYIISDAIYPIEERFPRELEVVFKEISRGGKRTVLLRINGINFGDRLTDNVRSQDGYRFHDIFHFSYMVMLGWSPVIRALLKCKRKSDSDVDENEDGARAQIMEEAVSAAIFAQAKLRLNYKDTDKLEYGLLKTIHAFVVDFQASNIPLWQWETAILKGYELFRYLIKNRGGTIYMNLDQGLMKPI